MRVGVVAVQGAIAPHLRVLAGLGHRAISVRSPADLEVVEGLVLPGGESTAQWGLLVRSGLGTALEQWAHHTRGPVLATCAGLILAVTRLCWLDLGLDRNAWGNQLESFEATSDENRPLVFIRAPRITRVSAEVEVCDRFRGEPVGVRSGAHLGCCFHPELSGSDHWHRSCFGPGPGEASR